MPENKLKGGYRIKMHQPKHCSSGFDTKWFCLDDKLIMKIAKILNKKKKYQ